MTAEGSFLVIEARDPDTVCADAVLLVCGLRTLGVPLHPGMPFRITTQELDGQTVTLWQWLLGDKSADGVPTGDLLRQWQDPAWLAAHPRSDLAIVRAALVNMATVAGEIRAAIPRVVIRRGALSAHIPANASPARRAFLLGQLDGTVALNAVFKEKAEGGDLKPESGNGSTL